MRQEVATKTRNLLLIKPYSEINCKAYLTVSTNGLQAIITDSLFLALNYTFVFLLFAVSSNNGIQRDYCENWIILHLQFNKVVQTFTAT